MWNVIGCVWAVVFFLAAGGVCAGGTEPAVYGLKCEYKINPIGIDVKKPRLSWRIASSKRAVRQSAYQIRSAASLALNRKILI